MIMKKITRFKPGEIALLIHHIGIDAKGKLAEIYNAERGGYVINIFSDNDGYVADDIYLKKIRNQKLARKKFEMQLVAEAL